MTPAFVLMLSITVLLIQPFNSASTIDIYGNVIESTVPKYPPSACCLIPKCQKSGLCYNELTCSYQCSTEQYRSADQGHTPGYSLRNSYTNYVCWFGECRNFEVICNHCQDPRESDFDINTVRRDCKDCYYKKRS
ncbi:uncharacterized protein [Euwallacea similis]|uniref:uncharacterized protein n=1 Tax=Euwallacea similis TaxID=1736056 RepID=UPI003450CA5D